MARDWRQEIRTSGLYICVLDTGFYGSVAEAQLAYAMDLGLPVVMVVPRDGRQVQIPQAFEAYPGPKRLVRPPANDMQMVADAVRELHPGPITDVRGYPWDVPGGG